MRAEGVSASGGVLHRSGADTYVYEDTLHRRAAGGFRIVERPTRHIQGDRVASRRHLPLAIALVALAGLVGAAGRATRAFAYVARIHAWAEAMLEAGGRVVSTSGAPLGMVDRAVTIAPGPVLLDRRTGASQGICRDAPILTRRSIVAGSHDAWRRWTLRRERDARVLAIVGAACAGVGLAARLFAA